MQTASLCYYNDIISVATNLNWLPRIIWYLLSYVPRYCFYRSRLALVKYSNGNIQNNRKILVEIVQSNQIKVEKHFVKSSQQIRLHINSFRSIIFLSQKTVSTSSLKNLQKTEKCQVQRFMTFAFNHEVASKLFSKKLPMIRF